MLNVFSNDIVKSDNIVKYNIVKSNVINLCSLSKDIIKYNIINYLTFEEQLQLKIINKSMVKLYIDPIIYKIHNKKKYKHILMKIKKYEQTFILYKNKLKFTYNLYKNYLFNIFICFFIFNVIVIILHLFIYDSSLSILYNYSNYINNGICGNYNNYINNCNDPNYSNYSNYGNYGNYSNYINNGICNNYINNCNVLINNIYINLQYFYLTFNHFYIFLFMNIFIYIIMNITLICILYIKIIKNIKWNKIKEIKECIIYQNYTYDILITNNKSNLYLYFEKCDRNNNINHYSNNNVDHDRNNNVDHDRDRKLDNIDGNISNYNIDKIFNIMLFNIDNKTRKLNKYYNIIKYYESKSIYLTFVNLFYILMEILYFIMFIIENTNILKYVFDLCIHLIIVFIKLYKIRFNIFYTILH
jgi:hypothetical protein